MPALIRADPERSPFRRSASAVVSLGLMDVIGGPPLATAGAPDRKGNAASQERSLVLVTQGRRRPRPVPLIRNGGREQPLPCQHPTYRTGLLGCLHATNL